MKNIFSLPFFAGKSLKRKESPATKETMPGTIKMIKQAKANSATDLEIHDTVLIAALFSLYNRLVDGLASVTPDEPVFYERLASILKDKGYLPSENRYANLAK